MNKQKQIEIKECEHQKLMALTEIMGLEIQIMKMEIKIGEAKAKIEEQNKLCNTLDERLRALQG
jgi:peptidoglycan hydrolase CwlO-like protein